MDGALVHEVELPVKGVLVGAGSVALEEDLAHERLARLGGVAQGRVVGRHLAPADHLDPFLPDDALEDVLRRASFGGLGGGEEHGDAVLARRRQLEAVLGACLAEEGVGDLNENPGTVTGVVLAPYRAAVVEVFQDGYRLLDDLVGFLSLDVGDEADAAGVVLELGIVHPLLLG